MKVDTERAEGLAENIVALFYENGFGSDYTGMHELGRTKIAQMIEEHDKEILTAAHARYVEAAKKCGD